LLVVTLLRYVYLLPPDVPHGCLRWLLRCWLLLHVYVVPVTLLVLRCSVVGLIAVVVTFTLLFWLLFVVVVVVVG